MKSSVDSFNLPSLKETRNAQSHGGISGAAVMVEMLMGQVLGLLKNGGIYFILHCL
jgi:hypothetical protein